MSGMFDQVAPAYDRTNTVLSMGNDRFWRAATTRAVAPRRGQRILDLAAGTGASSVALARSGASVVAADFSPGMIAEGRRRHSGIPAVRNVVLLRRIRGREFRGDLNGGTRWTQKREVGTLFPEHEVRMQRGCDDPLVLARCPHDQTFVRRDLH